MARDDKKEVFRSLIDSSSDIGYALERCINDTTDPTGVSGAIGFSYKKSSGEVTLVQLTAGGSVPVDLNGGTKKQAEGEDENGDKTSFVDVATLVLTASKVYEGIRARVSCRRDTLWELVGIEDAAGTPVETMLEKGVSGSGQFTIRMGDQNLSYTAGTTGTLQLVVRAKNFDAASAMAASITCIEEV